MKIFSCCRATKTDQPRSGKSTFDASRLTTEQRTQLRELLQAIQVDNAERKIDSLESPAVADRAPPMEAMKHRHARQDTAPNPTPPPGARALSASLVRALSPIHTRSMNNTSRVWNQ